MYVYEDVFFDTQWKFTLTCVSTKRGCYKEHRNVAVLQDLFFKFFKLKNIQIVYWIVPACHSVW